MRTEYTVRAQECAESGLALAFPARSADRDMDEARNKEGIKLFHVCRANRMRSDLLAQFPASRFRAIIRKYHASARAVLSKKLLRSIPKMQSSLYCQPINVTSSQRSSNLYAINQCVSRRRDMRIEEGHNMISRPHKRL